MRKGTINFVMSVRPSARFPSGGFHEILHLSIFRKPVEKIHISLKSDINNRQFTWWTIYIYDNMSPSSSKTEKCFRPGLYKKWKQSLYIEWSFSPENCALYDVIWKKYGTAIQATDDNVIRRMRFACWTSKATGIHWEYVIRISFLQQQWWGWRIWMLLFMDFYVLFFK